MYNKILLAIELLKENKSFKINDILLNIDDSNNLIVNGWSKYFDLNNLNTKVIEMELQNLKLSFNYLLEECKELREFIRKREIVYILNYDSYGKGSFEICKESKDKLIWLIKIR